MRNQRKTNPTRALKKSIRIICEGETEQNYLSSMRVDRFKEKRIKIQPELPRKTGWNGLLDMVERILDDSSNSNVITVFCVIDMDTILSQNQMDRYDSKKSMLQKRAAKKAIPLFFIESMPCIEFWFLLHFIDTDRYHPNYESIEPKIKEYIPSYSKKKEFTRTIFSQLKQHSSTAISRSIQINSKERLEREKYSFTKMNELISRIDEFTE